MKTNDNTALPTELVKVLQEQNALQAKLEVTKEAYQKAVSVLLEVAHCRTGQSEPAANLLLSLYNSFDYHFPLVDLCRLDLALVNHALIAIRGRVLLSIEPQEVITHGEECFDFLISEFEYLHVDRRYNKDGR